MQRPCTSSRIILGRRVCGVVLLLLVAGQHTALAQKPLSWPNRAPYVRVEAAEEEVLVPSGAAQAAQRHLSKPPDQWGGGTCRDEVSGRRMARLWVDGGGGGEVGFLVTRQSWSLFTDRNLAALNVAMERSGRALAKGGNLDNPQRLGEYLGRLDGLEYGMCQLLNDEFVRFFYTGAHAQGRWLEAHEKRASVLKRFCHTPVVARQAGGEVTITYNKILFNGSVVRRTVHARVVGGGLELLRLETVVLRPVDTFSYPTIV